MAIIRCAECKAKVSDKASTCPKCGAPIVLPEKKKSPIGGCGCLIILLIIGGMFALLSKSERSTTSPAPLTNDTGATQSVLTEKQRKEVFIKSQLLSVRAEQESIGINPLDAAQGLSTGEVFQLTKQTPLVLDISQMGAGKAIPSGYFIKLKSIQTKDSSTWYEVAVADPNKKFWAKGYINQIALMGQRKPGALSPIEVLEQQTAISERIFSKYELDLVKEYNITTNDLMAISVEAVEKGWVGK